MPTLLSDPSTLAYVLLGLAAAGAGFAWVRSRNRTGLRVFAALVALAGVVAGIDYLVESPREEAVRRVRLMEVAINARDWTGLAEHVSDKFKYEQFTKTTFRDAANRAATQSNAKAYFSAFDREQVVYRPDGGVKIVFTGRLESPSAAAPLLVAIEATFGPDADGKQRLRGLKVVDYIDRRNEKKLPGV